MTVTVTIPEDCYASMVAHVRAKPAIEQGMFAICGLVRTETETRLLVREVVRISDEHIVEQSAIHMKIAAAAYVPLLKRARDMRACVIWIHSHPQGAPQHSEQDDRQETDFFRTVHDRIAFDGAVHGSLIMIDDGFTSARAWLNDGTVQPIERVRVVGRRAKFWFFDGAAAPPAFFDRQVRAFGADIQRLLGRLTVGVVGAGGTGSAVIEQLIRLGVGRLVIADGDHFSQTNVNRVYGSGVADDGRPKVEIARRTAAAIGLGTAIETIDKPITFQSAMKRLRQCDVIFGCTDDEYGRALLTTFAILYLIPTLDMGVRIASDDGMIKAVTGRVTLLSPGAACLHCRGRLNSAIIASQVAHAVNPEQAAALAKEGYVVGLADPAPAVIAFTTTVAASAVTELLHMLTGFKGDDHDVTEIFHLIADTKVASNRNAPREDCPICNDRSKWGRGDVKPFLNTTWRHE